jgi:hypothetical protein
MWLRLSLMCGLAAVAYAQQNPMDLLRRVRAKVAESLERQPRYMCTETVERSEYESGRRYIASSCDQARRRAPVHQVSSDRLRLDVAEGVNGEMYSWVGESRFNDRDLLDMVQEGAISNGAFSAFLSAVFRTEEASFTYNGDITEDGRKLSEFGFRVPYEKSHYRYGRGSRSVTTGYEGTFLVDPNMAALVRLVVRTDPLPLETAACFATTTLDYASARMRGIDFLLPADSALDVVHTDGGESRNRTVFSNCHEFLGESTISFGDTATASASAANGGTARKPLSIPEGLRFRVALAQSIDTAAAAVGDPVKAKLASPIRDHSMALIPAGAAVAARIVRIRQFYGREPSVSLGIRIEAVETAGSFVPLTAGPDPGAPFAKPANGALQRRVQLGVLQGMEDRAVSFAFQNVRLPYVVEGGIESNWITAKPATDRPAAIDQKYVQK